MVWSCYVDTIKGPMVFFDDYKDPKEKITKIIYTKVLDDHLVPFIAAARLLLDSHPIFQHDNAPVHKVSNWLKSKKIDYMNWPSRSPDLNPIENIQRIVKDNIQNRDDFPRDKPALKMALTEAWSNLDTSVLRVVSDSMTQRTEAIAAVDGRSSKY